MASPSMEIIAKKKKNMKEQNLMIVCGQGTWQQNHFYSEYPEKDAYIGHIMQLPYLLQNYQPDFISFTGGFTQKETGGQISEAASMVDILKEKSTLIIEKNIIKCGGKTIEFFKEEAALDSVENIIFSVLKYFIITRGRALSLKKIFIYSTWQFKKERFVLASKAIGIDSIMEYIYFSRGDEIKDLSIARQSEKRIVEKLMAENDPLMLSKQWEEKRMKRFQGSNYALRDILYREHFSQFMESMDRYKRDFGLSMNKKNWNVLNILNLE